MFAIDPPGHGRVGGHFIFTHGVRPSIHPENKNEYKISATTDTMREDNDYQFGCGLVGHLKFVRLVNDCTNTCDFSLTITVLSEKFNTSNAGDLSKEKFVITPPPKGKEIPRTPAVKKTTMTLTTDETNTTFETNTSPKYQDKESNEEHDVTSLSEQKTNIIPTGRHIPRTPARSFKADYEEDNVAMPKGRYIDLSMVWQESPKISINKSRKRKNSQEHDPKLVLNVMVDADKLPEDNKKNEKGQTSLADEISMEKRSKVLTSLTKNRAPIPKRKYPLPSLKSFQSTFETFIMHQPLPCPNKTRPKAPKNRRLPMKKQYHLKQDIKEGSSLKSLLDGEEDEVDLKREQKSDSQTSSSSILDNPSKSSINGVETDGKEDTEVTQKTSKGRKPRSKKNEKQTISDKATKSKKERSKEITEQAKTEDMTTLRRSKRVQAKEESFNTTEKAEKLKGNTRKVNKVQASQDMNEDITEKVNKESKSKTQKTASKGRKTTTKITKTLSKHTRDNPDVTIYDSIPKMVSFDMTNVFECDHKVFS